MRRLLAFVAVLGSAVLVPAGPASAHTVSGAGASNYRTTLVAVTPAIPRLSVRVVETGSRIELTNHTGADVLVLGYEGEPYLRVGPEGVFRNSRSPATYLNVSRQYGALSPVADAKAAPVWQRIADCCTVRWHDHRIHWMGGAIPPQVRRAPGQPHVVFPRWEVDLRQGSLPIAVTGTLTWVPGPSPWPWLAGALALFTLTGLFARSRRWGRLVAAAMAVLVASDAVHAVGIGFAFAGTTAHRLLLVVATGYYSIIAWAVGVIAVRLLLRENPDGLYAATFAALVIGLFSGLTDVTVLWRSQVPFALPATVDRVLVSLALGIGGGVVVAGVWVFRRHRPRAAPA